MASLGSIFVDLLVKTGPFEAGMNRAAGVTKKSMGVVEQATTKAGNAIANVINLTASGLSIKKVLDYADAWKSMQGRLSLVTQSFGDMGQVQNQLFRIAQETRQPLQALTNFYARLSQFVPEAERQQYDLLGVTKSVTAALAITGETSESASAAMIQFTQAIGTNFEAAGQELRSLQEQAPRLAKALVDSLGGGTKSLQQLKDEGKLTRQSVLNSLSSISEQGQKLAQEMAKIPTTIGQSFTQLDNAFLKYIGQSEAITSGTTSIALAITKLSENFNTLANVVIFAGTAYATRYAAQAIEAAVATARTTIAAEAATAATAALTGTITLSGRAFIANAAGVGVMTAAMRVGTASVIGLARSFYTLIGGPVGAFVLLTWGAVEALSAFSGTSEKAAKWQAEFENSMSRVNTLSISYIAASEDRREAIRKETEQLYKNTQFQLKVYKDFIDKFNNKSFAGRAQDRLAGLLGFQPDVKEIEKAAQRADQMLGSLQEKWKEFNAADAAKPSSGGAGGGGKSGEQSAQRMIRLMEKYKAEVMGVDQATVDYNQTLSDLNELAKVYPQYAGNISAAIAQVTKDFENSKNGVGDFANYATDMATRAAENIQDSFAEFLFDPFKDGLDGMAKDFIDTMRKMQAQAIAQKLGKTLFGGGGAEGLFSGFGNFVGKLFGGVTAVSGPQAGNLVFPSFDVGTPNVPHDMLANIHKGEAVLTPAQAQEWRSGGGNRYIIDARGADAGAVARIQQAMLVLAGPGKVEKRWSAASKRGAFG
jgi:tape measure domain-containing protein